MFISIVVYCFRMVSYLPTKIACVAAAFRVNGMFMAALIVK